VVVVMVVGSRAALGDVRITSARGQLGWTRGGYVFMCVCV
jgi:hypothetical protein